MFFVMRVSAWAGPVSTHVPSTISHLLLSLLSHGLVCFQVTSLQARLDSAC